MAPKAAADERLSGNDSSEDDAAPQRGTCKVGGDHPAATPNSYYCAEHKPGAKRAEDDDAPPGGPPLVDLPPGSGDIETALRTQLEMAAQIWGIKDPVCARVLHQNAGNVANYWAQYAARSERVRKAIEGVMSTGGVLGALAVHAPLITVVMAHHVGPAIQRRREAAEEQGHPEPGPSTNGQGSADVEDVTEGDYPDGTRAYDPESGQVMVFHDGHWGPEVPASPTGPAEPPPGTPPEAEEFANAAESFADTDAEEVHWSPIGGDTEVEVDRFGHPPGRPARPSDDAGDPGE